MMLVDRFRLPPPSKLLVSIGVHWLNGLATVVVPSKTYWPLAAPVVAVRFRVIPDRLTLVMRGAGLTPPETTFKMPPARLVVSQARPAPGEGRLVTVKAPLMPPAALNKVNVSFTASSPARMETFKVPPKASVPPTDNTSLVAVPDLLNFIVFVPPKVTLPSRRALTSNDAPEATVMVALLEMEPLPLNDKVPELMSVLPL